MIAAMRGVGTKVELNNGSEQRTKLAKTSPKSRRVPQEGKVCQPNACPKKKKKITDICRHSSIHEEVSSFPQNFSSISGSIKTKGSIQPSLKLACASRITIHHEATLPDFFFTPSSSSLGCSLS
jgi:hypothetical protein